MYNEILKTVLVDENDVEQPIEFEMDGDGYDAITITIAGQSYSGDWTDNILKVFERAIELWKEKTE